MVELICYCILLHDGHGCPCVLGMSNCTILTYTIYLQLLALANSAGDMTDEVDQLFFWLQWTKRNLVEMMPHGKKWQN